MKQTDPIRALTAALLGLASLSAPSAADALTELGGAHFSPSAPLVPGVEALLPGAGDIGAYSADLWHVVYVKDEVVFLLMEDGAGGWSDPEPVTTEEAVSPANAQIGAASGFVHVVWEDDRTGQTEVWTRKWDGVAWSDEECLSPGGAASRAPVLSSGFGAFIVWEDGEVGARDLAGRYAGSSGTWGGVEAVAAGFGDAHTAGISNEQSDVFLFAWTDTRNGTEEVFYRRRVNGGVYGSPRVIEAVGPARNPDISRRQIGGDSVSYVTLVTYEVDEASATEVWASLLGSDEYVVESLRISAEDGVDSFAPNLAGFGLFSYYLIESHSPNWYVTWTDAGVSGAIHLLALLTTSMNALTAEFANAGLATSRISEGYDSPRTKLAAFWIQDDGDGPALWAQFGSKISCVYLEVGAPNSVIATPSGTHANTMILRNSCGGTSGAADSARVEITPSVRDGLIWAPGHPIPPYTLPVDPDTGEMPIYLAAGGCVEAPGLYVKLSGVVVLGYDGVRSPDVNGDCLVDESDRAYVEARLGGSDYCADLDGSNLVDGLDLAFVDATMGEMCLEPADAPDPVVDVASGLSLRVAPNPAVARVRITVESGSRSGHVDGALGGAEQGGGAVNSVQADIVDVAGRRVRTLVVDAPATSGGLEWDLRDDGGRGVPSGLYWVRVVSGGSVAKRAVSVVR